MLKPDDIAPDFTLISHLGDTVTLREFAGKSNVVLIFYPGNETPVCTKQLCEIRDDYSLFRKKETVVFGINPASIKSHKNFATSQNFPFPLLVDENKLVAKAYKSKGFLMTKRTVYIIDKQGKIIFARRGKPSVGEIIEHIR